jgi:LuxR family maltose regulon positive regulatory protein
MALPRAEPPLATRLHAPPPPPRLVPRPQLMERLQQSVERPLTLIAAPAGFGKTTLLAAWLEQSALQSAWLSLEPDDDDLTRFWCYVFTALARVQPGSGASALSLLQGPALGPPPPIETVLSVWINELAALPRPLVLVLDDYHVIAAQPLHRSLAFLVEHLPPQLHLIISTRADPPLPLARLRARGQLSEIRAADLRFSAAETAVFLTQALGPQLSAQVISALEARTEGWIVGLQLAALSLQGRPDISGFVETFAGSHRYIVDYLLEEVLAQQPEPVQNFLLQTAILERLQGALCDAVLGEPGAAASGQAMLEHLEQANLFLTPLDDERLWYRYHQLFAEALRHRLQRRQPALVPGLHRRASAWHARHGLLRDAVHHALAAADFEQAARLMEQAANALVRRGEIATLQRWVDALPSHLVRSRIEIAVWRGWLLFVSGQHEAAERHLDELERTFAIDRAAAERSAGQATAGGPASAAEIYGRITAIRASIAIIHRDLPGTIALSRLALEYLPAQNMARAYVAWYLGKALWLSGDLESASTALAAAERVSWEVGHLYGVFLVVHDLAQLQIAQGHLRLADQTYRQALARALEQGGRQPALGPAYVGRGNLEREWNHLEAAAALLEEGLRLCEQTGNMQLTVQAELGLGFVLQARGEAEGARATLRRALQIAEQPGQPASSAALVKACQAWLALLQGDVAAAMGWAHACGLSADHEPMDVREREALTLIRVFIQQRRLDQARQWLARLLQRAQAQGRGGSVIEILMLQAEVEQAAGELDPALDCLARALALAEPEGYIRLFVDEGPPLARLLALLRARPGSRPPGPSAYCEQLLAVLGTPPDEAGARPTGGGPRSGVGRLSEPLSERELEVLRLIVAGNSNREIADRLVLALSTVKWYVNILYSKLQVKSRTKAIARARELNLV